MPSATDSGMFLVSRYRQRNKIVEAMSRARNFPAWNRFFIERAPPSPGPRKLSDGRAEARPATNRARQFAKNAPPLALRERISPPFFYRQLRSPILQGSGAIRTMEINARAISGLDPGAIPGGSTISFF